MTFVTFRARVPVKEPKRDKGNSFKPKSAHSEHLVGWKGNLEFEGTDYVVLLKKSIHYSHNKRENRYPCPDCAAVSSTAILSHSIHYNMPFYVSVV